MAVDPLIVKVRLDIILERVTRIKQIETMTEEQYLKDELLQGAIERNLQIIAQAIIDICTHLVAHNHWGSPKSYAGAVTIVANHQVIDSALADRLIHLVKLRNVLVHLYLKIDEKIVYQSARSIITDAKLFTDSILEFVDSK
ncbi:DUF86 domain-containing protein [Candidatus Thorarchaeota archaeon]|nr:MAG: DUF86 domain-containing protein [Candidatus Thorarchaeota archaeon]